MGETTVSREKLATRALRRVLSLSVQGMRALDRGSMRDRVISPVRPAPKRRKPSWDFQESAIFGPLYNPAGDLCSVFVMRTPQGCTVVAVSFPADVVAKPFSLAAGFDHHAHAIIAENVLPAKKAKRLAETWARAYQKGIVLAPCECGPIVGVTGVPITKSMRPVGAGDPVRVALRRYHPTWLYALAWWAHARGCTCGHPAEHLPIAPDQQTAPCTIPGYTRPFVVAT